MSKKIAVIVRDRQSEALRMSAGITFMDDTIELFFLDQPLQEAEDVAINLEIANEMEVQLFTNVEGNSEMHFLPTAELQRKLLEYDHIIAY